MNERAEIARGQHAAEALDNPIVIEALDAWELEITEAWKSSPLRDAEGRERLRLMLEAARTFRAYMARTLETGKLAEIQVQQARTMADRVRGAFR